MTVLKVRIYAATIGYCYNKNHRTAGFESLQNMYIREGLPIS